MKKLLFCGLLVLAGCSDATAIHHGGQPAATPSQTQAASPSPTAIPSASPSPTAAPERFTVVSGGDILFHLSVTEDGRISGENYDFSAYWDPMRRYVEDADLAICALETPIIRRGEMPSGYPNFGAPTDLAASLAKVGYDGCAIATNHTMDRGFSAAVSTIDALEEAGLGWAGSARNAAEGAQTQFYTIKGENHTVEVAHGWFSPLIV